MLVPDRHYAAVSDWINGHHLSGRIVYYRVPQAAGTAAPPDLGGTTLAAKLEVKDSPFASWLERELAHRADLECVETMAEFRRMPKAITKAGQVKGCRRQAREGRPVPHRRPSQVRARLVQRTQDRRHDQPGTGLAALIASGRHRGARATSGRQAAIDHGQVLAGLDATTEFAEIDYESVVNEIAELHSEHDRLTAASAELARLDADLKTGGGADHRRRARAWPR